MPHCFSSAQTPAGNEATNSVRPGSLEPESLLRHFIAHPPAGFHVECAAHGVPVFATDYDILTTASPTLQTRVRGLPGSALWSRALRLSARFAGTTVSEYFPLPVATRPADLVATLKARHGQQSQLLVLKDIPWHSPLLDAHSNTLAVELSSAAADAGFVMVNGQALAYVPVDFPSVDGFLQRFSRTHRRDLRRKLRSCSSLDVSVVTTGSSIFSDADFLEEIYALYLNVYQQSTIHFDLLSRDFMQAILKDADSGGILFLYRHGPELIGWNLCYVAGENLVDKYVGFRYPQARVHNLYAVSWFHNLEFAHAASLRYYVAGWTDPEVKAYLGASFTLTRHAVFVRNPVLRAGLKIARPWLEQDTGWAPAPIDKRG